MSRRLKLRLSSPTTGWWKCLTAVAWKRTLCAAQWVRNGSLCVASSPTRSERSRSYGSRPAARAQDRGGLAGGAVPVGVERFGARIEEDEPGMVGRPSGLGVQLGEQRAPEVVGSQDVETVVADDRGGPGDRVEGPLDLWPDALFGLAATRPRPGRLGGAGEVEQVGALGVIELERAGQRVQHALGGAAHVSALQAGVVRDAHAGQDGDLPAAQSGNAATAVRRQPHLLGGDPGAAGGEELADLLLGVHGIQRRPGCARLGTLPVPLSTGSLTGRGAVVHSEP